MHVYVYHAPTPCHLTILPPAPKGLVDAPTATFAGCRAANIKFPAQKGQRL